mmetsp:Transcript_26320/g.40773  ORF Transcript_26320/g.40773 Transcript_26320/m.40773 type:complete len:285 (-) Transcript_26320:243-1097(-)
MVSEIVYPTISSGFERNKVLILKLWAGLFSAYFLSIWCLLDDDDSGFRSYLPSAAAEYCTHHSSYDRCSRPDLMVFQVFCAIAVFFCGIVGFISWHITYNVAPGTQERRLFGYIKENDMLATFHFAFQTFDFAISLSIPERVTPVMLLHHLLTGLAGWFSMEHQYLHYYGLFYLGCSEISSIFLVFVTGAKYFPPVQNSTYQMWVELCKVLFAITFFWYRVILWLQVSSNFWKDVLGSLGRDGSQEKLRPGKAYIAYYFLAINIVLTMLQLFWFGKIMKEALKF